MGQTSTAVRGRSSVGDRPASSRPTGLARDSTPVLICARDDHSPTDRPASPRALIRPMRRDTGVPFRGAVSRLRYGECDTDVPFSGRSVPLPR